MLIWLGLWHLKTVLKTISNIRIDYEYFSFRDMIQFLSWFCQLPLLIGNSGLSCTEWLARDWFGPPDDFVDTAALLDRRMRGRQFPWKPGNTRHRVWMRIDYSRSVPRSPVSSPGHPGPFLSLFLCPILFPLGNTP